MRIHSRHSIYDKKKSQRCHLNTYSIPFTRTHRNRSVGHDDNCRRSIETHCYLHVLTDRFVHAPDATSSYVHCLAGARRVSWEHHCALCISKSFDIVAGCTACGLCSEFSCSDNHNPSNLKPIRALSSTVASLAIICVVAPDAMLNL